MKYNRYGSFPLFHNNQKYLNCKPSLEVSKFPGSCIGGYSRNFASTFVNKIKALYPNK